MPYISKQTRVFILVQAALVVFAVILLSWFFSIKEERLSESLQRLVEEQRRELLVYADLSDKNLLDEDMNTVIRDCRNRSEFDQLLISLESLGYQDLLRTSNFFAECGNYFAIKKSITALRLERELEVFEDRIALLHDISSTEDYAQLVTIWSEIVALELTRADRLQTQAQIQDEIIQSLLSGERDRVSDQVRRAVDIAEFLSVENNQLDALREEEQRVWGDIVSS